MGIQHLKPKQAGDPGPPKSRIMCRVIKDDIEFEHKANIALYATNDKAAFATATRENPVKSWDGRCLYWREDR